MHQLTFCPRVARRVAGIFKANMLRLCVRASLGNMDPKLQNWTSANWWRGISATLLFGRRLLRSVNASIPNLGLKYNLNVGSPAPHSSVLFPNCVQKRWVHLWTWIRQLASCTCVQLLSSTSGGRRESGYCKWYSKVLLCCLTWEWSLTLIFRNNQPDDSVAEVTEENHPGGMMSVPTQTSPPKNSSMSSGSFSTRHLKVEK